MLEVRPYLDSMARVLLLQGSDGLVDAAMVPLGDQLELGPQGLLVVSVFVSSDGCPFLVTVIILVLVLLLPLDVGSGQIAVGRLLWCPDLFGGS